MNPFLKAFNATSNADLKKQLQEDDVLLKRFNDYQSEFEKFNVSLQETPSLRNQVQVEEFFREHNFFTTQKAHLILLNTALKPVRDYVLDLKKLDEIDKSITMDIVKATTPHAAILYTPLITLDTVLKPTGLNKNLRLLGVELFDIAVGNDKHVEVISRYKENIFFSPSSLGKLGFKQSAIPELDKPLEPFKRLEIFDLQSNYLYGYHDFKQHEAEEKLKGLHIEINKEDIKKILVEQYRGQPYETADILCLDNNGYVYGVDRVNVGNASSTAIDIKAILGRSLDLGAHAFVMVHNHPSGNPAPSEADINMTHILNSASSKLDCPIYDHFVVGHHVVSFVELSLMKGKEAMFENLSLDLDFDDLER